MNAIPTFDSPLVQALINKLIRSRAVYTIQIGQDDVVKTIHDLWDDHQLSTLVYRAHSTWRNIYIQRIEMLLGT